MLRLETFFFVVLEFNSTFSFRMLKNVNLADGLPRQLVSFVDESLKYLNINKKKKAVGIASKPRF